MAFQRPHPRVISSIRNRDLHRAFVLRTAATDGNEPAAEGNAIPVKHQKLYHLKGASTSPAIPVQETNNSRSRRRPRANMCGPGVTITNATQQHTIQTDVPKSMGGANMAPQPVELLLASLTGCTQATAIFVARQLGCASILRMELDLQAIRDERGALALPIEEAPPVPSRLRTVAGQVVVYTSKPLLDSELSILQEQTELRCPVANMMVASGCHMNIEWIQRQE